MVRQDLFRRPKDWREKLEKWKGWRRVARDQYFRIHISISNQTHKKGPRRHRLEIV